MNVLFLGLGSIGQRHLQNLIRQRNGELKLHCVRNTSHNFVIKKGDAKRVASIADFYGLTQHASIEDACSSVNFDVVFVCTPSSCHFESIDFCIKQNIHVFVEKPLVVSASEAKKVHDLVKANNKLCFVGYQSRYDPIWQTIIKTHEQRHYGRLLNLRVEWGTYLPYHHRYENYKDSYAARQNLGGGVMLGLSHELEILLRLFPNLRLHASLTQVPNSLEIDVDESVYCLFWDGEDCYRSPISLALSYSQIKETRRWLFSYEKATVEYDIVSGMLYTTRRDGFEGIERGISRDKIFENQMKDFLKKVDDNGNDSEGLALLVKAAALIDEIKVMGWKH